MSLFTANVRTPLYPTTLLRLRNPQPRYRKRVEFVLALGKTAPLYDKSEAPRGERPDIDVYRNNELCNTNTE
jgi:hypothetical protein